MKKLLLIFLIPICSFTQNGDTNGDGFVNLEDLFNVLENWLLEVNANEPESISNIDEMINIVDSLITINQNLGISKNPCFPEGLSSQIINYNLAQGEYVVPEGKRLYVLNVQSDAGLFIDGLEIMYNVQSGQANTLGLPIVINSNQSFTAFIQGNMNASFNGFLVDETSNLEAITLQVNPDTYTVPSGKILLINHYYSGNLAIDNNTVLGPNTTTARYSLRLPTMVGSGQEVSCDSGNEGCVINGYLVDEDYFSSVSNNSSNNNQPNTNNNTSVSFNYSPSDCDYINSLEVGTIIHQPTETSIVVMGRECGSVEQTLIPSYSTSIYYGWSQSNYIDRCDLLHTFTVNDTIVIGLIPNAIYSSEPSILFDLGESDTEFHPNNFTNESTFEFVGLAELNSDNSGYIETILVPGRIYGRYFKIDQDYVEQMQVYTFPTNFSEVLNNNNLWKHEYNLNYGINWVPTIYYAKTQSTQHFYNFGKKTKSF